MGLSKKQQKLVDALDRRVRMCEEFMADWRRLTQIIGACRNPAVDKAMLQRELDTVKIKLARAHGVLRETLQSDYSVESSVNLMNILYTVPEVTSLATGQSEVAYKKLQGECNRAEMSLYEMLGRIQNKRARAQAGEKIFIMPAGGVQAKPMGSGGLSDKAKRNIMIIAAVIIVAAIIFFVPPIRNLYREALVNFGILPRQGLTLQ